jgi:hypothetical protein
MSWPKKFPQEAPGMIFETQGRGQYPPNGFLIESGPKLSIKVEPDRIVKSSRSGSLFRR